MQEKITLYMLFTLNVILTSRYWKISYSALNEMSKERHKYSQMYFNAKNLTKKCLNT